MKTSFDKCFVLPFLLLNGLSTDLSGGKIPLSNMYIYFFDLAPIMCSHGGWLLLKCCAIGIGFNGAETNFGIARILGILLMNSCDS